MKSHVSHHELVKYRNALMRLLKALQVKDMKGSLAEDVKTVYRLIEFIDSNGKAQ